MGLIWPVTIYMGKYNLDVTHPVGECFQGSVSNPVTRNVVVECE